jgi:hypothetical protein
MYSGGSSRLYFWYRIAVTQCDPQTKRTVAKGRLGGPGWHHHNKKSAWKSDGVSGVVLQQHLDEHPKLLLSATPFFWYWIALQNICRGAQKAESGAESSRRGGALQLLQAR